MPGWLISLLALAAVGALISAIGAVASRTPAGRAIRLALIGVGGDLSFGGRWAVAGICGGIWYLVVRQFSHTAAGVGAAVIAFALFQGLKWGRARATLCPHCRKHHPTDASVCPFCQRDVPSRLERL